MHQPLDLCITLVPPPADAAPESIAGIELRCDQLGLQHKGDVLEDPLTAKDHGTYVGTSKNTPSGPMSSFSNAARR